MQTTITIDQLETITARANERFDLIRKKYPTLKAYLVFASWLGQAEIESPPENLLTTFPAMFLDNEAKAKFVETPYLIRDKRLAGDLQIDTETRVEIRFKDLKYELVWKLQQDDLVDRILTPQTKASIRIVLGSLAALLKHD